MCQKIIINSHLLLIQLKQIIKNNLDEIFFIKINVFFFIIIYDSHVLCSYSSHLIRNSNHANFMFHFMSLIKLIKYRSSLFSIIMNYDDDTYLLIELSFKNHNKLM